MNMCDRCVQIKKATAEINASSIDNKAFIIAKITAKIVSEKLANMADLTSEYTAKVPTNEEPPTEVPTNEEPPTEPLFPVARIKQLLTKLKDVGIVYPSLWDFESDPTELSLTTALDMLKTANIVYPPLWKFVSTPDFDSFTALLKAIGTAGITYPKAWDAITKDGMAKIEEHVKLLSEAEVQAIKDCVDDPDFNIMESLISTLKSKGIVDFIKGASK